MAIRLHSTKYNSNYWFIPIPKTGTQSIRKYIETNLPESLIEYHTSRNWHMELMQIVRSNDYSHRQDNFFSVVRNPWSQAWSNFNYQRDRVAEKIDAYNAGQAGIDNYRKLKPNNIIEDYSANFYWPKMIEFFNTTLASFDNYIYTMRERLRYPIINTIEDLDRFFEEGNSAEELKRAESSTISINGILQSHAIAYDKSKVNNVVVMPIEKPELLLHFMRETFPEIKSNELPFINKGVYSTNYTSMYTKKMIDIVHEMEYSIIARHGYKFGE